MAAEATPGMTNGKCNENARMAGGSDNVNASAVMLLGHGLDGGVESVLMSVEVRSRQSCGLLEKVAHMIS